MPNLLQPILLSTALLMLHTSVLGNNGTKSELVVVSWGGAFSESQRKAIHDPYQKNNPHIQIIHRDDANIAISQLRKMNENDNVTWDLVDVSASEAMQLCDEGLVETINHDEILAPAPDGTSPIEDFEDQLVSECFIPQIVYSATFGYRTDKLDDAPRSIADVFDLKKFPGKRSMIKGPIYNMEWALIADGVAEEDIYDVLSTEEGIQRAFDKLDTIRDQTIWWMQGSQTPELLATGEVVMGSTYNGRLFSAIEVNKHPIGMMWDYQIFDLDGWVIPKGAKNREEAIKLLKFATDTQRLADLTKYIAYGPARRSSAPLVSKHEELGVDMAPHMPTHPANSKNVLLYNYEWWAENRDELTARFNAWLGE